jgi:hypothetical protein
LIQVIFIAISTRGDERDNLRIPLIGIEEVYVVAEDPPRDLRNKGLSHAQILTAVELTLRNYDITIVSEDEWVDSKTIPYLYLSINGFRNKTDHVIYNVTLQVQERVLLHRENSNSDIHGSTWSRQIVGVTYDVDDIKRTVKDLAEQFVNDLLAANEPTFIREHGELDGRPYSFKGGPNVYCTCVDGIANFICIGSPNYGETSFGIFYPSVEASITYHASDEKLMPLTTISLTLCFDAGKEVRTVELIPNSISELKNRYESPRNSDVPKMLYPLFRNHSIVSYMVRDKTGKLLDYGSFVLDGIIAAEEKINDCMNNRESNNR